MTDQSRGGAWLRSMLFVPGHRLDMMLKTPRFRPDAVILDLEDAVPLVTKSQARGIAADGLEQLRREPFARHVRVNPWGSGLTLDDVLAIVGPALDGIMLAKTGGAAEITTLDLILSDLESSRGLEPGAIEIVPAWETARAMRDAYEICAASTRVRRTIGLGMAIPGADVTRALGLDLRSDGYEALFFGTRHALDARAAGVVNHVSGMTTELEDLALLRRVGRQARAFGANGGLAFHPTQIPVLHEIFTPDKHAIAEAKALVTAMADAVAAGNAAIRHNGVMVDYAHVRVALDLLDHCSSVGIDVGPIPEIDVP
jgi:citrate lyase subunit beta / citryl-CoA lyase